VQEENPAPSSEHWKLLPASFDVNEKLALAELVKLGGPAVIVVSGSTRSIVQVCVAGVGSVFPAGSVARTSKVWPPSARPLYG
jgi:hypothetical protein